MNNKVVLIGNGFDLSHGMETGYNHFIKWYIAKSLNKAWDNEVHDDDLLTIWRKTTIPRELVNSENRFAWTIDLFYEIGFHNLMAGTIILKDKKTRFTNPFTVKIKHPFFTEILNNCSIENWVDIENSYYRHLLLFSQQYSQRTTSKSDLEILNGALDFLIKEFEKYLLGLNSAQSLRAYADIISGEAVDNISTNLFVVNFNYTNTPFQYLEYLLRFDDVRSEMINIHGYLDGELGSEPLFGFGDEMDSQYPNLEKLNINKALDHVKSFSYLRNNCYRKLIDFLAGDLFDVSIIGHSCGLSDRTLLNMIFEHEMCNTIQVFHHLKEDKSDNYKELTQNISRHFNDKKVMRNRVLPFNKHAAMIQA